MSVICIGPCLFIIIYVCCFVEKKREFGDWGTGNLKRRTCYWKQETHPFLVHLDQRSMWTIAITWRPSSVVRRLLSVVCKLFTFQASSPKPLCQLEPNLAGMFLGWSSTKLLFFIPVGYSTWLPGPIICSDWLKIQRSSSLKLMNWLNPKCKRMIIGMSFTKDID